MDTQEFIPIAIFCRQHSVEQSFISSLQEFGLVNITMINEAEYMPLDQLKETEKLVRLYRDLGLNMEGIDVVVQLLHRIKEMQHQITLMDNRLCFYEINE